MAILRRRLQRAALVCALAAAFAVLDVTPGRTAPRVAGEDEVKAAFVYHFAKFVDWPGETHGAPAFTMCVASEEAFADTLREQTDGKRALDKPIAVRVVVRSEDLAGCQVLYLPASATPLVPADAPPGTLVVADGADAAGASIALVRQGSNVRFVVDVDAAQRAGLGVSSQLLKLAVRVIGVPAERQ